MNLAAGGVPFPGNGIPAAAINHDRLPFQERHERCIPPGERLSVDLSRATLVAGSNYLDWLGPEPGASSIVLRVGLRTRFLRAIRVQAATTTSTFDFSAPAPAIHGLSTRHDSRRISVSRSRARASSLRR